MREKRVTIMKLNVLVVIVNLLQIVLLFMQTLVALCMFVLSKTKTPGKTGGFKSVTIYFFINNVRGAGFYFHKNAA